MAKCVLQGSIIRLGPEAREHWGRDDFAAGWVEMEGFLLYDYRHERLR